MIRVLVADDHEVVRQGLRRFLSDTPDLQVVGEARDGAELLALLESVAADVLVLDLSLPRVSGLEVLRRVRTDRPGLRVVVLSMYPVEQFAPRLRREGAAAYVSKERPMRELVEAVRAAWCGPAEPPAKVAAPAPDAPHRGLSPREYQVFMLVALGRTNAEMAQELALAPSTISNTLARVKAKLGVASAAEIVAYAIRTGLLA